jgi:glycosyltransferase involved in cell wall biosynthesis
MIQQGTGERGGFQPATTAPAFPAMLVDHSHCGRAITGLERLTLELFSAEALRPLPTRIIFARGRWRMVLAQTFGLPALALANPRALVLCSGFPPSPALTLLGDRVIPYIHDLFLLTRPETLNIRARLYMAPAFRFALPRLPRFFVNSESTRRELLPWIRPDAEVHLFRPRVRNVFGVCAAERGQRPGPGEELNLLALGTIEPRKNLFAAADLVGALRQRGFGGATLHVVGRPGWGVDLAALAARPGVVVHGYLPLEQVRERLASADALITTSHDEGLGMPQLEAQYSGIATIASDKPVFREVLGSSGLFINPADPVASADAIGAALAAPDWRAQTTRLALDNLESWNIAAAADQAHALALLERLGSALHHTGRMPALC